MKTETGIAIIPILTVMITITITVVIIVDYVGLVGIQVLLANLGLRFALQLPELRWDLATRICSDPGCASGHSFKHSRLPAALTLK